MKNTNVSSVVLAVIRDLNYIFYSKDTSRILHNVHFDLNRLEKIEKGSEKLTIDDLYEIAKGLRIPVSTILYTTDQVCFILYNFYSIYNGKIDEKSDEILSLTNKFFKNLDGKENFNFSPIIYVDNLSHNYTFNNSSSLLQYLINDTYRIWLDSGAKGIVPEPIYPPTLNYLK